MTWKWELFGCEMFQSKLFRLAATETKSKFTEKFWRETEKVFAFTPLLQSRDRKGELDLLTQELNLNRGWLQIYFRMLVGQFRRDVHFTQQLGLEDVFVRSVKVWRTKKTCPFFGAWYLPSVWKYPSPVKSLSFFFHANYLREKKKTCL